MPFVKRLTRIGNSAALVLDQEEGRAAGRRVFAQRRKVMERPAKEDNNRRLREARLP
jgi:hypothetical protein